MLNNLWARIPRNSPNISYKCKDLSWSGKKISSFVMILGVE